jgi:hypothetical protein
MAMSAHHRREDSEMMIVTAFRHAAPPGIAPARLTMISGPGVRGNDRTRHGRYRTRQVARQWADGRVRLACRYLCLTTTNGRLEIEAETAGRPRTPIDIP